MGKLDYAGNGGSNNPGEGGALGFDDGPPDIACPDKYPACDFGSYNDEAAVKKGFNGAYNSAIPIGTSTIHRRYFENTDGCREVFVGATLWN